MSFFGKKASQTRSTRRQRKSRKAGQIVRGLVLEGLGLAMLGFLFLTTQNDPTPALETVSTVAPSPPFTPADANTGKLSNSQGLLRPREQTDSNHSQKVIAVEKTSALVRATFWGSLGSQ